MTSKEKYTDEVERMVKRYEEINQRAKTVIRKPTAEELKFYEEVLAQHNSPKYPGGLTYQKGES